MTHATLDHARQWLARDGKVAMATVIETWGSAPVRVGGQMAIALDGRFEGSVSGGCVEGDVLANAAETLSDGQLRTLGFGIEDATAWAVGLPCGGKIRIMLERFSGTDGAAHLDALAGALAERQALVVQTDLKSGARTVTALAGSLRSSGIERQNDNQHERFLHVNAPALRTVIIGATHIGQALAQAARLVEHHVTVIDPRSAFAADVRFPDVALITDWPEGALATLGLDPFTAVAVVAHVEHIDDEALIAALRSSCAYVGALGSKRSQARRVERLTAAGLTPVEIAKIKAPIGVDIGAATPPEIALSIMAEIVAQFRKPIGGLATATSR